MNGFQWPKKKKGCIWIALVVLQKFDDKKVLSPTGRTSTLEGTLRVEDIGKCAKPQALA